MTTAQSSEWDDEDEYDDPLTAFIQDMSACIDCPYSEACPIGTCEKRGKS